MFREGASIAKKKIEKVDGLGAHDIDRIKKALRQVWSWSYSRRLVVNRCLIDKGFSICESCKQTCPKIFVDHIEPIGSYDGEYIERLFVSSSQMQGLCAKCHKTKTKQDLVNIKEAKQDFF